MYFLILAKDGNQVMEQRLAHRDAHLARIAEAKAEGLVLIAGPTFDEAGSMNGSYLVTEFNDLVSAKAWVAQDLFSIHHIWQDVNFQACAVAPMFLNQS